MAESSSHNTSSPEITPKEEHVTLDKPESPNHFLPAIQVEFTFKEIAFTTNNEVDYAKLTWEDLIHKQNKKTREKIVPYRRFISLLLEHMMLEYDNEELTINHTQTEASKSKTGQSEIETKSSSAKDKILSHLSPPTLVVGEMHKETQQATGGQTSLGATSEEGTHPQLSSGSNPSILVDKTKSARDGLKTTHPDLDDPIIVRDESKEEEADKEDTHDTSHDMPKDTSIPPPPSRKTAQIQELMAQVQLLKSQKDDLEQQKATAEAEVASLKARSSYPDVNQLTTLLVTSLKPELSRLLASHNFASCLPTNLKEL
ncbi:hypothetical protein Tco_1009033 [Tanacetum coccineum]